MSKRNIKYQGVSLPVPILNKIKEHMNEHSEYTSITDFIRESIRDKIERDNTISDVRKRRAFNDWELVPKPYIPKEEIVNKNPFPGMAMVKKDHTIELEAEIIELKKQVKEIHKLLKNKK